MTQLPPGPRSKTVTTIRWAGDPIGTMLDLRAQYGDPWLSRDWIIGSAVSTASPEGLREIYTAPPDTFLSPFDLALTPLLGASSIFLLAGDRHKRERQLLMPPFHRERMRRYGDVMRDIALRHAAQWTPGQELSFYDVTLSISMEIIIRNIFGVRGSDRVKLFKQAILDYAQGYTPLLAWFPFVRRDFGGLGPWSRYQRALAQVERLLGEEIDAQRQSEQDAESILKLLIDARHEDGSAMTRQEILDELKTLIFAGYETVAISSAWAFYWIHHEPQVHQRLLDELSPLGSQPDPADLVALPYLDAVTSEALRLYSPVPSFPRRLVKPLTLRGYELPAGMSVIAQIVGVHLNPDVHPEPRQFRPERFLERTYTPFEFAPFGGGARRCVGAAFAEYEMKVVIGTLLARYRLSIVPGGPEVPVSRTFLIAPRDRVKLVYEKPRA